MKHILAQAPVAVAAIFVVACASSQKNLTGPQQAALQAEEQSQKAQDDAQKAREAANKTQGELNEAQAAHTDAQRSEIQANARAQQASYNAGRAEAAAGAAAHPAAPPQGAPGAQQGAPGKGVAEAQGAGAPSSPGKVVIITTSLLFPTGSSKLSDSAKPDLDKVADALKQQPHASNVSIEGHTDSTGSQATNMKLSEDRAQAVADYLESKGVAKDHIMTKGVGSEDPASHANSTEGRAVNRRVDITVESNKGAAEKQGSPEKQGTDQKQDQKSQPQQPMQQGPGMGQPQQQQQWNPNQQWQPKESPAPDGTGPQHPTEGGQPQTY